ncbi:MAG: ADP-glyceromanno-heptose 6-epimerase [Chitinophagaceae bacterium]|nr:ADP-glyceromanno-heptose 6-epimerase [Chitinophagaceae bacterium]
MQTTDVIAITGAAGFIGSYLTGYLNKLSFEKLILVDDFSRKDKALNLEGKKYIEQVDRNAFLSSAIDNPWGIQHMFHLGARTDTTELNYAVHKVLNLDYSIVIWEMCTQNNIPLVYASSAATYGDGEHGYKDDHDIVSKLQPLNAYGQSKNDFDEWALTQTDTPPFWAGVKFFNVYGPNEYHKARMASVIFHAYYQIKKNGGVKLFRSHIPEYKDGEQQRDFIYVKDVAEMCTWLMNNQPKNGLYNIGTGKARTFNDLVKAIFHSLDIPVQIEYRDTPEDRRDKYQYFTEADMNKLTNAGYTSHISSLEEGVSDYVTNYLEKGLYF